MGLCAGAGTAGGVGARGEGDRVTSVYSWISIALWLAWIAYWGLSAMGRDRPDRFDGGLSFLAYRVANVTAILLLLVPRFRDTWINARPFEPTDAVMIIGVVLTAAGLLFAVWARVHLGAQWTGRVGVRAGHQLVRTGPYGFVRHPIYSGVLLAFIGSALVSCDWRSLVAIVLMVGALSFKLQREERWMAEHFPTDYPDYLKRVAAIIPGVL